MQVVSSQRRMDQPFKKNAKYADLELIPDGMVGEIVDGDLYAHARPRIIHGRAIARLLRQLGRDDDDDSPTGWVILPEPEIWFGKHLLVPDLAGWRRKRLPEIPDVVTMKLAPDWVCEGLSPSTAWLDKGRKREIYAGHNVGHQWFADPALKELEVYVLDGKSYRVGKTAGGNVRVTLAPFTHAIDLAKLWQR
jgi:Uma2 family endonuclease